MEKDKKNDDPAVRKLGIAFVHQELNLFNDLKVYENIFLMKEYKKKTGALDKKRMIREAQSSLQNSEWRLNRKKRLKI